MEYRLSDKRIEQKQKYEEKIKLADTEYVKISEEISKLRKERKSINRTKILELQISQKKMEMEENTLLQAIEELDISQLNENCIQKGKNKELQVGEAGKDIGLLKKYKIKRMNEIDIAYFQDDIEILELEMKLLVNKNQFEGYPEDKFKEEMALKKEEIANTIETIKDYEQEEIITREEADNIFDELSSKYLEEDKTKKQTQENNKDKTNENYKKEISSRSEYDIGKTWEHQDKQDINKEHIGGIYHNSRDYDNKFNKYSIEETKENKGKYKDDYLGYIGSKIRGRLCKRFRRRKVRISKRICNARS